jgi:pimeloyl-ACP methyl ester carboxylesterase
VAHSMGGMVALYELMYGTQDVVTDGRDHPVTWAGASDLGRVVLLGTPLDGTMAAFRLLQNGFSRSMSPEVVFTMPSVYQLLPSDGRSHFLNPSGDRSTSTSSMRAPGSRTAGRSSPRAPAHAAARRCRSWRPWSPRAWRARRPR